MTKKIFFIIKYFSRKIDAHKVGAYSAEGAYFIMLSIFPFIILLLSLVRFLPFDQAQLLGFITDIMPGEVNHFFKTFINEITTNTTNTITIISAGGMLWSASKGVYSIIGGLNSIFELRETRNYFKVQLLSVFYTLSFIIMIVVTFILLVFGNRIVEFTEKNYPYAAVIFIIMSLRYLIGFCLLVSFFMIIYKVLPSGKQKYLIHLPGAIVASVGWISFSYIFSFYIDNFANYSNIYGSITAVVLVMLWLYSCMYILFFGGEINLYYFRKILGNESLKLT